jgi:hypothetical protein
MKISKNTILLFLLVLFTGLPLIPIISASSLGLGDFFLTDKELPSNWEEKSYSGSGPHMAVREKFMGGSWSAKQYQLIDSGLATVIIGYYPTEEEAKKAMRPDVYAYRTDPYTNTATTLKEWDNKKDNEQITYTLITGTSYGEEGYTPEESALYEGSFMIQSPTEIFRIGNVIFQVSSHYKLKGILEPLIANKAKRLIGSPVKTNADEDGDGVIDDMDTCPSTLQGIRVDGNGCPDRTPLQKIHQMNIEMITQLQNNPAENSKRKDMGMKIFKDPSIDPDTLKLQKTDLQVSEIKPEIEKTQDKINKIIQTSGGEKLEIKTIQGTDTKIVQKDENIPVKKDEYPGLFFTLKYSVNQQADKIIDEIADKIPYGLGKIFKDYLKAEKDTQIFSNDENIKKTQTDLGVTSTQAELYTSLSGVEDKQTSLSPGKNLIPTSTLTKPFEYTLQFMELGIKKTIAEQYEKEYLEAKAIAQERRESGDSWSKTMDETEKQIAETWGYTGYGKHVSYLNTISKDQVGIFNLKTQAGRIKFYIQMMREKGELQ